jgi:hypothetical protein
MHLWHLARRLVDFVAHSLKAQSAPDEDEQSNSDTHEDDLSR